MDSGRLAMSVDAAYLARFADARQERLAAFAAQSSRIGDLARTHPLAFSALAMGYGDAARHSAAIKSVIEGERLRVVCDLAGIPLCLRSVPPELCPTPLPHAEWSAGASRTLTAYVPEDPSVLIDWLPAVFFAHGAGGEIFALWLAKRHELFNGMGLHHRRLLSLALYVWFAEHPEHELGRLIPARWSFHTGTTRMLFATRTWLNRIVCRTYLPGEDDPSRHIACDHIGPMLVFELTDYRHLLDEQQAMSNCLDRYGRRLSSGTHRIFSLRSVKGTRIATFEVNMQGPDGPALNEIKGPADEAIPARIERAVSAWTEKLSRRIEASKALQPTRFEPRERTTEAEQRFRRLLEPYVSAHAAALKNADVITMYSLENDLANVAQRVGITDWPAYFKDPNYVQFLG